MSSPPGTCPLCGRSAKEDGIPDGRKFKCDACGVFGVTESAESELDNLDPRQRAKIGFWTRDQNDLGELPIVFSHTVNTVLNFPEKTVWERAERLLRFGIKRQKDLGETFTLLAPSAAGITHSRSETDVLALAHLLYERGWLREKYADGYAQVSAQGFIHAGEANVSESVNGFIAMWFDKSMDPARADGFEPAIREAGYTPVIVSGVEHINKIDDEIISQIRRSKFLVADFTGHRGGVYFEAGFAMGLGIPVFWTCRQDDIKNLHFDIRQYNSIDWTDPADIAARLRRRIEAVIGPGPIKSKSA
jgi:hypothetical protein